MGLLKAIDGYKTYAFTALAAIFVVIEFFITGDFSLSAWLALGSNASVAAVVASLRHAISKTKQAGGVK